MSRDFKKYMYLIAAVLLALLSLGGTPAVAVQGEEADQVSSFEELCQWIDEHMAEGGSVSLKDNIIIPEGETYTYINARHEKEIEIRPEGHTIYVEGTLEIWPYLTVNGPGGEDGVFCVRSGGKLTLTSVTIDTGSPERIAMVQENGAVLEYGEDISLGLPAFSCTGRIISAEKTSVLAASAYNYEDIPLVEIPEGSVCTPDQMPEQVAAYIWREGKEILTELPVVWDAETFPEQGGRAVAEGSFGDSYAVYRSGKPLCLVVTASEDRPYFLHCYASEYSGSVILVIRTADRQGGELCLWGSDDGEHWKEIGQAENRSEEGAEWLLPYIAGEERPFRYYEVSCESGGETVYSDILEFTEDMVFTSADIDGGRGGELGPGEGEDLLPDIDGGSGGAGDGGTSEAPADSGEDRTEPDTSFDSGEDGAIPESPSDGRESGDAPEEASAGRENGTEDEASSDSPGRDAEDASSVPYIGESGEQESGSAETAVRDSAGQDAAVQITAGILIVAAVLACSAGTVVKLRRK